MKKIVLVWFLAVLTALLSAVYQRVTGPTYPVKLKENVSGHILSGKLPRSGSSSAPQEIKLQIQSADSSLTVFLQYRKYRYEKKWEQIQLVRTEDGFFTGQLPPMPPAGKLEYTIFIEKNGQKIYSQKNSIIIRFKGDVPAGYLIPHIIFIFLFMIISNGLAFKVLLLKELDFKYIHITLLFIILGGLVFGPIVQKFAFGEFWTGVPFGYDLTDNKVLIAFIFWLWAFFKRKSENAKLWALTAALSTLIIFLIPHSVLGSELNFETMEVIQR